MKYDHVVKYNGKYYEAGEDVPNKERPHFVNENRPSFTNEKDDMDIPFADEDIELETGKHKYTQEELEQMTAKEMRKLAEDNGFKLVKTIRDDLINEFLAKQQ